VWASAPAQGRRSIVGAGRGAASRTRHDGTMGAVEPAGPAHEPDAGGWASPSPGRVLWRGLTRRCPVCGATRIFRNYFTLLPRCPRCGLRFRRLEGHWSGDIGINTIVSFTLLFFVLLGGTLLMWGDLNVMALAIAATAVTLVFPVAFVPVAKTLWTAIDVMMRPVEPDELDPGYLAGLRRT
jgi:uncharacterized protein (DUF983 family)